MAHSSGSLVETEEALTPVALLAVDGVPARRRHGGWGRAGLAAAAGACALVAIAAANPLLLLVALVTATALLLARWLPADVAVPAAVLALTGAASALGMTAALLHLDLLARPSLTAVLALAAVVALAATSMRPGHRRLSGRTTVAARLTALPALGAAALGLMQGVDVRIPAAWALYGTDLSSHMRMLRGVQDAGALDYTADVYPRGLHMLLALVSVGVPQGDPTRLMDYDLRLMAGACWLAMAAVLWTAAVVTRRLGTALGVPGPQVTVACWLLGLYLLTSNSFMEMFVTLGAAPSLVAFLALWALPLALLSSGRTVPRVAAVAVAAVMLLAQLWQPLVVVPVGSFLAYAAPHLLGTRGRELLAVLRRRPAVLAAGVTTVVLAGAAAAGPVLGAVRSGGFSLAGAVGQAAPVPVLLLVASGVACVGLLLRGRGAVAWSFAGGSAAGLAVVALSLVGAGNGLDLTQWYPNKVLWFLVVFLAPVTALALVVLAVLAWRLLGAATAWAGPAARVVRVVVVAAVVAVTCSLWVPQYDAPGTELARTAALGGGDNESSRRYDIAREQGVRPEPVLPMFLTTKLFGDLGSDYIVSKLLSFQTGQPTTFGRTAELCSDLRAVAAGREAVVVTTLDPTIVQRLLEAQQCAATARVVQLPGLDADLASQSFRVGLPQ
jgi:hypothetical protein